jgi:hypothetical protein
MSELKPTEAIEKPGYKTSEFWLTLAVTIIGALMSSGILADGHIAMKVAGLAMSTLAALGYTASRANVKRTASMERASLGKPQAQ